MQIIPSIDLQAGRSRLVFWPGAAAGTGTPTDRPERICRHFVEQGAPMIHLVDLDGARRGAPANTDAIQAVARAVAVPLQLAGGVDGPEQIELAFAAGATRVVVPFWAVAEDDARLRECLRIATDWLAIGIDARPERLADYPWRSRPPQFDEAVDRLAGAGVRRLILSHWSVDDLPRLAGLRDRLGVEIVLAGGLSDPTLLGPLRAAQISAVIVGEPLFSGAIDYAAAL
ncbi:MAG TPA: HisA/HisF-related TIM barrel protein [Candidatus Limnocylindria bacterium]|nr:HisA/HisF-related TIM barrel protein [Candidatus Limnocylindria bacterium]